MLARYFTTRIFVSAVTFISNLLIARYLGAESFGLYAVTLATLMTATVILSLGTEQSLLYFMSSKNHNESNILLTMTLHCLLSLVCILVYVSITNPSEIALFAIGFCALILYTSSSCIAVALDKIAQSSKYMFYLYIAYIVFILLVINFREENRQYTIFLYGYFSVLLIYSCLILTSISFPKLELSKNEVLSFYKYGFKIAPGNIFGILKLRLPIFFIAAYNLTDFAGQFAISMAIIEASFIFPVMVSNLITKEKVQNKESAITDAYRKYILVYSLIFTALVVCVPESFYTVIFGLSYKDVPVLLNLLIPITFLFALGKYYSSIFLAANQPFIVTASEFINLIVFAIAFFTLKTFVGLQLALIISIVFGYVSGVLFLIANDKRMRHHVLS